MRKLVLTFLALAGLAAGALPALGASDHAVAVKDFAFDARTITIATGDTVVWNDAATYAHNVKFDDGFTEPAVPSTTGWPVRRTFTAPGTYAYHCEAHVASSDMRGTVVVRDQTTTTTTTADPAPTPTVTPAPTSSPAAHAKGLVVRRAVKAGRVRGHVDAGPAGARLTVRVRFAGRAVGTGSRQVLAAGPVAFAVRLSAPARRRLARRGSLGVRVRAEVRSDDTVAVQSRVVRLR